MQYVLLATSAAVKVREYKALLDKYGIEVAQAPSEVWDGDVAAEAQAKAFADPKCIAVLRDQAHLLAGSEGETEADLTQLTVARSRVRLCGRTARGEAFEFTDTILGFNDPSLKRREGDAFGWDDTFVNLRTGRTLFDGSGSVDGVKISSRDAVVSRYISKYVHYKQRVDLAHAADLTHMAETIDFSFDPARFVAKHPLLSKGLSVPGYGNMLRSVLNGGLLFRSAANRREVSELTLVGSCGQLWSGRSKEIHCAPPSACCSTHATTLALYNSSAAQLVDARPECGYSSDAQEGSGA